MEQIVEQVERLPEREQQVVLQQLEIYRGDLPHPDILRGYNELYPGAAQRIIENGIKESEHRRKMEETYLVNNIEAHRLGQYLGFAVAMSIILAGVFLIFTGHSVTGSIMTGISAIGVVSLFTGKEQKVNSEKEDNKK